MSEDVKVIEVGTQVLVMAAHANDWHRVSVVEKVLKNGNVILAGSTQQYRLGADKRSGVATGSGWMRARIAILDGEYADEWAEILAKRKIKIMKGQIERIIEDMDCLDDLEKIASLALDLKAKTEQEG